MGDCTTLPYLSTAVVVEGADVRALQAWAVQSGRSNLYQNLGSLPCDATLAGAKFDRCSVYYAEVQGGLVNTAGAGGSETIVGCVVQGTATVSLNAQRRDLFPGDAVLFFPGDVAIQALRDCGVFTLRLPVSTRTLVRVKSRPFRALERLSRWPSREDSLDMTYLLRFFASEFDRSSAPEGSAHINTLAHALVERVASIVDDRLGPDTPSPQWMHEVCAACETAIAADPGRRHSADDLAVTACCSVRQLHRAFGSVAQTTPYAYQLRSRLIAARSAIIQAIGTHRSPASIARSFGFASPPRFCRAYRAEYGESPENTQERMEAALEVISSCPMD